MSEQNDEISPDAAENTGAMTWGQTVEAFEAAADWLKPSDKPQLKALYAIAALLDAGTVQAALISQFTLVHSRLLARGAKPTAPGEPDPDDEPDILDLWGRRS